jgi:hypothetical protein
MQRNYLAIGLKNGRVEGNFHWMTVKVTGEQAYANSNPLRPVHAIMIAVPAGLALWAAVGIALLR